MAGHGGARPGAGAPVGGISQIRRVLVAGITRGLADAMRDNGRAGSDEDLATAACADIVRSLAHAGRGDEVLKLFAQVAPKSDEGAGSGDGLTPLDRALGRMPSAAGVPKRSQAQEAIPAYPAQSTACNTSAPDYQSDAPLGAPCLGVSQLPLLSPAGGPGSFRADTAGRPAGTPPPPPAGHPTPSIPVSADGLEKNGFENSSHTDPALPDQVRAGGR